MTPPARTLHFFRPVRRLWPVRHAGFVCPFTHPESMELVTLGWRASFQEALDSRLSETDFSDDLRPARVFRQDKHRYLVHDGDLLRGATVVGKLLYESDNPADLPAVGDWVLVQPFDEEAIIHAVLPRFSAFERKEAGRLTRRQVVAANIDTVFLVSGLDNDFNVRRIERYVVQTTNSGVRTVILLNKMDLVDDPAAFVREVERVAPGIDVITASATEGVNMDAIRTYTGKGETVAFLGSSGVGKSSIVNRLMEEDRLATQGVREDDSRGRHTTTRRELAVLPGGGLVMDTPGLRELQLWSDASSLDAVFQDIADLGASCHFSDCRHGSEPDCAVQAALASGELDADRFESYVKLQKELAYLELRQDEVAAMEARKRDKDFGKMMKEMKKHNPKR